MSTNKDTLERVLEWHNLGVKPGGIANALEEGLKLPEGATSWTAGVVRAVLAEQGIDLAKEQEAEDEGLAGHSGGKFQPPWLGQDGTWTKVDVRAPGGIGTVAKPTNRKP